MSQSFSQVWIGADVDSKKVVLALAARTQSGDYVALDRFGTPSFDLSVKGAQEMLTAVRTFLLDHFQCEAPLRLVMEATGHYSVIFSQAAAVADPNLRPAIINPRQMRDFARSLGQRGKNDQSDARSIARYGVERKPEPPAERSVAYERLRALMRFRTMLVEQSTELKNAFKTPTVDKLITKELQRLEKSLASSIDRVEEEAKEVVQADKDLAADIARVRQIPGIGLITAMTLLGELGDLRNFPDSAAISAFCGLSCKQSQSGKTTGRTVISRAGSPLVRKMLWMASLSSIMKDQRFGEFYNRLIAVGKHARAARCAVMRKIVCVMRSMVVKGTDYDPTYRSPGQAANV